MSKRPSLRGIVLLAGGLLWAGGLVFLQGGIDPSSNLNSRHEDLDIHTGRIRYSRYILYTRVYEAAAALHGTGKILTPEHLPTPADITSRPDHEPRAHAAEPQPREASD